MPKPFDRWTVLPHGKLTQVEHDLLTVTGDLHMPLGAIERRMTVVRLRNRQLVIYSAIALDEEEMKLLEAWGTPAYLVVPNGVHRTDAKIWKTRFPQLTVIAPAGARATVERVVPVDETRLHLDDPRVRVVPVDGTDAKELALEIHDEHGTTLVVADLVWNLDDRPGIGGWLLHALGFTGGPPHFPRILEQRTVRDHTALSAQLERWAADPSLVRIIPAHGAILTRDPRNVLHELASSLQKHAS
jgi:hypothetical protein